MTGQASLLERTAEVPEPPLIAGLMIGVRAWDLDLADGEGCRLRGYGGFEWRQGGRATVAECGPGGERRLPRHCLSPPGPDCSCGLYAFHPWSCQPDRTHRKRGPFRESGEFRVTGVIQAWGRIELHEDGFRAEKARPIAIVLPQEPVDEEEQEAFAALARRYRVPTLRQTSEQRVRRFATRRSQITPATVGRLVSGDDLEQTGPEWNRLPDLVPVSRAPSRLQPASAALGSILRASATVVNAVLSFAYFLVMAVIGLLMWATIIALWLPVVGLVLVVIWIVVSGLFGLVFG